MTLPLATHLVTQIFWTKTAGIQLSLKKEKEKYMKPIKSISGNCYMTAKPSLKSNSENDVSVILKCCHRSTGACSNGYSASKIICLQNVKDLVLSHCFQCCLIFFNFMKIESNKAVSRIWNKKQKTVISKFAVFPYRSVGNDQKEGPLHYS